MKFDEQSDLPMPCVDCGKEVGDGCRCKHVCRQCAEPTTVWMCGIQFCVWHARKLQRANQVRRGKILESLGYKGAA